MIEHAWRSGTAAHALVCDGRLLDRPERRVAAGDPLKCADRAIGSRELSLDTVATGRASRTP